MLGALGLTGCEPASNQDYEAPKQVTQEVRQSSYVSKEACEKDWGNDAKDCVRPHAGSTYMGPRYIYSHGGGYPMALEPDGSTRALPNSYLSRPNPPPSTAATTAVSTHTTTTSVARGGGTVSRGGFGGTAHGMSGGG